MKRIPIALPLLGEEEAKAARDVILSGWVTQGPKVNEFEEAFASYTGARFACAVSNCTTALHLALLAVGVRPGDVVITVSHSFIATANSIRHCQAEPIFVDIDRSTFNMDPDILSGTLSADFEEKEGSLWYKYVDRIATPESPLFSQVKSKGRLGALLVVHQVGMPADLPKILSLARLYNIPVVEDAACAIGSEISIDNCKTWEKIGKPRGDVACFSFHPRKVITTGDGGMLTTNNQKYDRQFRLMRQHGMSIPDAVRHKSTEVIFEDYCVTGYNYRMTDIQAAIGIEQLKRLPDIIKKRRRIAQLYMEAFSTALEFELPHESSFARTNWQSFIVRLKGNLRQKKVMQNLQEMGINTRRGIMCAHLEPPYKASWPQGSLPESEAARDTGIILPLYPQMENEDVEVVVKKVINTR
nr:DegT/DnrJ/EryC1/StrS family aminotransferase [Desulfobacula sp.]